MLVLSRRHLLQCHVQAPIACRERNHVFDPWFESRRPERQVSSTRSPKPVHFAQFEVVEHSLGESFPLVSEKDALAKRATLAGPVEAEHGPAVIRERLEKGGKIF